MVKVGIIIINYNSNSDTVECLKSLNKVDKKNLDLKTILIDNNSKDKLKINPNDFTHLKLEIIYNNENLGFSGGGNQGMEILIKEKVDYILLLNNDTIQDPEFLVKLTDFLEGNKEVAAVSPKIYFAKGFEFHKGRYKEDEKGKVFWFAGGIMDWSNLIGKHKGVDEIDSGQYDQNLETDFLTGCCFLIRREILEIIGLFDEKYFLYYEDSDLSERIKRKSFKIFYVPGSKIWHKNASSSGGSGSSLQDYFITRNRLIFGKKFAPLRTKLALIKESLNLIRNGREWQRKGVKDFYLRKFGKGSYQ